MTNSQVIQELIARVMEVAGELNSLTTEQAKDKLVQIGAEALIKLN